MFSRRAALGGLVASSAAPIASAATVKDAIFPPLPADLSNYAPLSPRTTPRTQPINFRFFQNPQPLKKKGGPRIEYYAAFDDGETGGSAQSKLFYLGRRYSDNKFKPYLETGERSTAIVPTTGVRLDASEFAELSAQGSQFKAPTGTVGGSTPLAPPEWVTFLQPTLAAESGKYWGALNTYDGVYLTYGLFQFAGHAEYMHAFVTALRAKAEHTAYTPWMGSFPNPPSAPASNATKAEKDRYKAACNTHQQTIRSLLNPSHDAIDVEELRAAAGLLAWACEDPQLLQRTQWDVCIPIIRRHVRAHKQLLLSLPGSDGLRCAQMIGDIGHHGRPTNGGERIKTALNSLTPLAGLCAISSSGDDCDRIHKLLAGMSTQTPPSDLRVAFTQLGI